MNTSNYTYLLANPQKITSEDLNELDTIIQKYPYFQSARALQLKGLKNQESFLYNDALKITAAHTTDRDILFEYITSEKFAQHEISQAILQHDFSIDEIKVISEDVSKDLSIELDEQMKAEMKKAEDILNPELFQRKVASVNSLIEKKEESPEEILQTDKPLEFTKSDNHSFAEWLKLTKARPIERSDEISDVDSENSVKEKVSSEVSTQKGVSSETLVKEEMSLVTLAQEEKDRKLDLIDRFIQERPKIIPPETSHNKVGNQDQKDVNTSYSQTSESLMTETLAKVYLQQKNYKKAIQAYKILILKNPEKSGFFADQIRAVEKLINT